MDSKRFVFDKENVLKALVIPLIIGAVLAFTDLLDLYFGVLFALALTFMSAFSGYSYIKIIISSGESYPLINTGINGGLVAGIAMLAFEFLDYLALSIRYKDWSISLGWTFTYVIEAAFLGFLVTLAWHAYKNDKTEQKSPTT